MATSSRYSLIIAAVAYFILGGFIGAMARVIAQHIFVLTWVDHNLLILVGTIGNAIGLKHLWLLSKSLRAEETSGKESGELSDIKREDTKNRFHVSMVSYVVGFVVFALVSYNI